MCVKWWLQRFDLRILKSVACLGISNTENFTKVETLAACGGSFQIITLYVVHIKFCVLPSGIFFVFSSILNIMNKMCKRAKT